MARNLRIAFVRPPVLKAGSRSAGHFSRRVASPSVVPAEQAARGESAERARRLPLVDPLRFPPPFVARLAKLNDPELTAVVREWAQIEEINCSPREIEPVVSSLVGLARSAQASNRGLHVWGSL